MRFAIFVLPIFAACTTPVQQAKQDSHEDLLAWAKAQYEAGAISKDHYDNVQRTVANERSR